MDRYVASGEGGVTRVKAEGAGTKGGGVNGGYWVGPGSRVGVACLSNGEHF